MARKKKPVQEIRIDIGSHNLTAKPNPIKKGYGRATVKANIAIMEKEGRPHAQAVAIALDTARRSYLKRYPQGILPPWLVEKKTGPYKENPGPTK